MPVKKVTKISNQAIKQSSNAAKNKKTASLHSSRAKNSLSVPVYSLVGRAAGNMTLPKEIFGREVNKSLLAQAVRVYATNQKKHPGSTKTRGEVRGSTAKIYRQKGTGRARHGAITAPIFVGGGIVFGPKPRNVRLELPKKMKKVALLSALSAKVGDQGVLGVSGLEKATGKTKEMSALLTKLSAMQQLSNVDKDTASLHSSIANTLIVTGEKQDNVVRGVRNIPGVDVLPANLINAYEVLRHQLLLITKEAVAVLGKSTTGDKSTTSTTGTKTRDTRGTRQSRDTLNT